MIIKTDKDIIKCYFGDESGLLGGYADKAVAPLNEKEASEILSEYSSKKEPLTISGGGTGVTGARVPFGGTILATDSLNKILDINKKELFATIQPGVRLSEFQTEVNKIGLSYLPDPTEPNAFFGGTVSTNACGAKGFRYGPTRNHIKKLKVALSTGDILDIKRGEIFLKKGEKFSLDTKNSKIDIKMPSYTMPSVKNAAGYYINDNTDLIDIFIGQEGTLGLILEGDIALGKALNLVMSFFVFFSCERDALSFIEEAKKQNSLSLEYMDTNSLNLLRKKFSTIPEKANSMVYFEQDYTQETEEAVINQWTSLLEKYNALSDASFFADSEKEREKLREFRHALPEMINEIVKRNKLPKVGTDIAVPDASFLEMFSFYQEKLISSKIDFVVFGHIGENHLHVNLLPKTEEEFKKSRGIYMEFVHKAVSLGGTVSAEHGIGKLKHSFLEAMYGKENIKQMAELKKSLDPACILGLDNIFPKELLL